MENKDSGNKTKRRAAKAAKEEGSLVKQWFHDHPSPLVHGAAIGYLPEQESSQFLIFVDPSAADCEREAIEATAPKQPHQLLRASRFVGLQVGTGTSINPNDPSRFNYAPMSTGTLGAAVTIGRKQYILSSNHVLAHNGRVPQDTVVVSPGPLDELGGGLVVAKRSHFVELKAPGWPVQAAPPNLVDCALAEVIGSSLTAAQPLDVFPPLPPGSTPPPIPITKTGRTTGTTQSRVSIFHWYGYIDFPFGIYYFEEMMGTYDQHRIFAAPGDSGSLAVDLQGIGVGLLTARGYVFDLNDQFESYIILICALDSVRNELAKIRGFGVKDPKNIKFSK
ncbi:MAG TPA: hypothetical protein VN345_08730 [Blastocatellia bacterium]|jgi:hypothetical protein|nr:hypothetical protein [Blastocatellia bacterium]